MNDRAFKDSELSESKFMDCGGWWFTRTWGRFKECGGGRLQGEWYPGLKFSPLDFQCHFKLPSHSLTIIWDGGRGGESGEQQSNELVPEVFRPWESSTEITVVRSLGKWIPFNGIRCDSITLYEVYESNSIMKDERNPEEGRVF